MNSDVSTAVHLTYGAVLHVQRFHSQQGSRASVRALTIKDTIYGRKTAAGLAKARGRCISNSIALQEARTNKHDDLSKRGKAAGGRGEGGETDEVAASRLLLVQAKRKDNTM